MDWKLSNLLPDISVSFDGDLGAYYTKQNYWSVGDLGKDWDCPSRWNNGQYQDAPYPKLFLFNHYRNVPTVRTAALDNTYEKIMDRVDNRCAQTASSSRTSWASTSSSCRPTTGRRGMWWPK